jgi:hypothetical protein
MTAAKLPQACGENSASGYSDRPMHVTKASIVRVCSICERTLLMGEHTVRFSPDGEGLVDVCPLCNEIALHQGWVREGLPVSPTLQLPLRRRRSLWSSLIGTRPLAEQPVVEEPLLRRLSDDEVAMVEAAELFNASAFLRTVNGVAKALGEPQVSIMPLSGVSGEMVLTFAWDISWYQYRVTPDSGQPVRLAERGHDMEELEVTFTEWNARLESNGRVMPELERL